MQKLNHVLNHAKIRQLREGASKSMQEMADDIHISNSMLGQIETGIKIPNANILAVIAAYLNVQIGDLYEQTTA